MHLVRVFAVQSVQIASFEHVCFPDNNCTHSLGSALDPNALFGFGPPITSYVCPLIVIPWEETIPVHSSKSIHRSAERKIPLHAETMPQSAWQSSIVVCMREMLIWSPLQVFVLSVSDMTNIFVLPDVESSVINSYVDPENAVVRRLEHES